jgi:tRNA U54 and U55 pseudouridine synthase Pus10
MPTRLTQTPTITEAQASATQRVVTLLGAQFEQLQKLAAEATVAEFRADADARITALLATMTPARRAQLVEALEAATAQGAHYAAMTRRRKAVR